MQMFSLKADKISDLVWSPFNKDEFIAYGYDFYLYRLNSSKAKSTEFPQTDECVAELVASFGENSNPKVISWYSGSEAEYMYAVAFANQKIQVINLNYEANSFKSVEVRKELTFKQSRQCNNLLWNSNASTYLAAGFEKIRNENSILVWDVNSSVFSSSQTADEPRVIFSSSQTETCNSLAWIPYEKDVMMAGVNHNSIKCYDIRQSKQAIQVDTKYVHSICAEPLSYLAASYNEHQIAIWDMRMYRKNRNELVEPLEVIDTSGSIAKIQWCQKRAGKLACLRKNSSDILTYSIRPLVDDDQEAREDEKNPEHEKLELSYSQVNDEPERTQQSRIYKSDHVCVGNMPTSSTFLKSFCWNNCDSSKILVVDNAMPNQNFKILNLIELSAMEWSPNGDFSWVSAFSRVNQTDRFYECEYSREFKERTKLHYGLKYDQSPNGLITCDFLNNVRCCPSEAVCLWQWFESVNRLFDFHTKNVYSSYFMLRYSGLRNLIDELLYKKALTSSEKYEAYERFRTITFNLCDWNYRDGMIATDFFVKLDQSGQFERAICLAIILNYPYYTDLMDLALKRDTRFGYIWVALKCLLDEKKGEIDSETRAEYGKLSKEFTDPYLHALFNYILFKEDSIPSILNNKNLLFQDRVALSVHFLLPKGAELVRVLDTMIEECVKNVQIKGVLLTGLSSRCINLFQAYIDKTSDIQTIALAIIHATFEDVSTNKQVKHWVDSYRELLNKLRLWEVRAIYDNLYQKIIKSNNHIQAILMQYNSNLKTSGPSTSANTPQKYSSVSLLCNYCGKNVLERVQNRLLASTQPPSSQLSSAGLTGPQLPPPVRFNTDVIQGCLECAKFLPQCAICLKFMTLNPTTLITGATSSHRVSTANNSNQSPKLTSSSSQSGNLKDSDNDKYSFLTSTKFGNAFTWCISCKHGGHVKHLAEWFTVHTKCPFPHCKCNCLQRDNI